VRVSWKGGEREFLRDVYSRINIPLGRQGLAEGANVLSSSESMSSSNDSAVTVRRICEYLSRASQTPSRRTNEVDVNARSTATKRVALSDQCSYRSMRVSACLDRTSQNDRKCIYADLARDGWDDST
jgi:hypothetical protein